MHVTRPKSAKGRNRLPSSYSAAVQAVSCQGDSIASRPSTSSLDRTGRTFCASPQPSLATADDIQEFLQQFPVRPSSSLNRYRVLPSIQQGGGCVAAQGVEASPKVSRRTQRCSPSDLEMLRSTADDQHLRSETVVVGEPEMSGNRLSCETGRVSETFGSLQGIERRPPDNLEDGQCVILAVRSPTGERFQHTFSATDTLGRVLDTAKARFGAVYKNVLIETMDVPRRSFSDMSKTLTECGIQTKSVLCIQEHLE
ncbi:UBX domain-containing protein 10 [Erpetoichthys calabaricus]|uniref:UBX domain-containing protein 10 n=1 Tax=Erpetoichthys calabaricus TaxID=27687 RepID=UPI0022349737|nr:UBX domain-containing protein 10 [Erpetoichthys calabaricus]XP_051786352.1 UBX domain-containing protein 10 [Erpetoichthys calabaricus]XP_051786353.1 UBX domain-containing protein 10 [Erpetoichthys calabaricus]XP_051786354.1 UBX domain-containing protein 10 [Erpetoichthys calabaricus]XP_051786355.1 UBX domain-containing protein 10 [Erpetoichthys calabaricus]